MISAIYDRVKLGRHEASSSLTSVLASRGNYTIFAPDNDAVQAYLDDIGVATVADLDEEQAKTIALNSVIDNGDESAYESADFPVPGSFRYSNLNNRTLTCAQDSTGMGYVINGTSQVTQADIEVSNGVIHRVATVIAPSADNVADRLAAADNMRLFSLLLTATTWADSLTAYRDKAYDAMNYEELSSYKLATETSTQFYRTSLPAWKWPSRLWPTDGPTRHRRSSNSAWCARTIWARANSSARPRTTYATFWGARPPSTITMHGPRKSFIRVWRFSARAVTPRPEAASMPS